jgi:hypothetical protein
MKICCKCKRELPYECFSKNKNEKDGYHRECKEDVKAYQLANKEHLKFYQQKYQSVYRTENYDKLMEYDAEWRKNNRDKVKSYVAKSNAKNPQRMKDYMKAYNQRKKNKNDQ